MQTTSLQSAQQRFAGLHGDVKTDDAFRRKLIVRFENDFMGRDPSDNQGADYAINFIDRPRNVQVRNNWFAAQYTKSLIGENYSEPGH